jgi:rhomboid family GlyGly-CTERM serine protease
MFADSRGLKPWAGRLPGASLLLSSFALLLWLQPNLAPWCEWNRAESWQAWRWLTGHFCHWSNEHFLWDVAVFLLLGMLCERRARNGFLLCLGVAAPLITGAVHWALPDINSYRGLSGLDSALFGWLVAQLLTDAASARNRMLAIATTVFACLFVGKLAFEWTTGSTFFVSNATSCFVAVPLAHAVGAAAGLISNLLFRLNKAAFGAKRKAVVEGVY